LTDSWRSADGGSLFTQPNVSKIMYFPAVPDEKRWEPLNVEFSCDTLVKHQLESVLARQGQTVATG
jgi:hypothetical protein